MKKNNVALNVNYYFMDYNNQLVLTGKLNDVGAAIRTNVADSYRMGIEVDGGIRFDQHFTWKRESYVKSKQNQKFH